MRVSACAFACVCTCILSLTISFQTHGSECAEGTVYNTRDEGAGTGKAKEPLHFTEFT